MSCLLQIYLRLKKDFKFYFKFKNLLFKQKSMLRIFSVTKLNRA